jgi:hypothetical protein
LLKSGRSWDFKKNVNFCEKFVILDKGATGVLYIGGFY